MSLHNIAKHLENRGRGSDSVLVHMSPREVGGLQALAKSQGGSLTRNPETGLYEAGFLEQVLPIVAAAAATYFTAGAAAPALAAATGMGATASGILAGAGAGALISGGTAAVTGKDVGKAALMGGIGGGISGGLGAYGDATTMAEQAGTSGITTPPPVSPGTPSSPVDYQAGLSGGSPTVTPPPTPPAVPPVAPQGSGLTVDQMIAGSGRPELSGTANTFDPYAKVAGENLAPKVPTSSSYYGSLGADNYVQKAGIQALPALGLIENQQNLATTPEQQSKLKRISPNFYAQQPIQPNPYYRATYAAEGGIMRLAAGGAATSGPVEQMTQNMMGGQGNMYPLSQQEHTNFATPTQMPASAEVIRSDYDVKTNPYTGVAMADGGIATLGSYSDGGRLLKGPGDGVSDNIPATIGGHQPARLADGEFVIPARIVSELGNGSTDAGAKRLYAMMDRIQSKRKKSMGKGKFAVNSKAEKDLPA